LKNYFLPAVIFNFQGFLDNVGWNDFEAGNHDVFVIHNLPDVGKVKCITLTAQVRAYYKTLYKV